jgi:NADH/NAD ratio-sensing transcriptional regulator Rex
MNLRDEIIRISIERWNSSFGGISASEIANKLKVEHQIILKELEYLESIGKGTLNKNVELCSISIDILESPDGFKSYNDLPPFTVPL